MTIYLCVDDKNGMLFNGRRQSRDAAVLADILSMAGGPVTIDPFSERLLTRNRIPFVLFSQTSGDCHYFVEDRCPGEAMSRASSVVLYRWNRHYPADVFFDLDLTALGFQLTQVTEFPGNSHELITKEVYTR